MKKIILSLILILSILVSCKGSKETNIASENKVSLEAGFQNPPQESKPRTWYHINSGNASKAGFTKDLEVFWFLMRQWVCQKAM